MNEDPIKPLCAAIVAHDQWNALQAYLLMRTAPSSGIDTLRNAIALIDFMGQDAQGAFKKPAKSKTKQTVESTIDPDLDEHE
jgi:hypothetical protein